MHIKNITITLLNCSTFFIEITVRKMEIAAQLIQQRNTNPFLPKQQIETLQEMGSFSLLCITQLQTQVRS